MLIFCGLVRWGGGIMPLDLPDDSKAVDKVLGIFRNGLPCPFNKLCFFVHFGSGRGVLVLRLFRRIIVMAVHKNASCGNHSIRIL